MEHLIELLLKPVRRAISRDVNKAIDSKAKAKAKAEAEASVPWHKLVIRHNFLKPCNTLNLSVSDASV